MYIYVCIVGASSTIFICPTNSYPHPLYSRPPRPPPPHEDVDLIRKCQAHITVSPKHIEGSCDHYGRVGTNICVKHTTDLKFPGNSFRATVNNFNKARGLTHGFHSMQNIQQSCCARSNQTEAFTRASTCLCLW